MQEKLFNSERAAGERSIELISLAACASPKWRAWLQAIYSTTDKLGTKTFAPMPLKKRTKRYVSGHPSLAKDEPFARQSWQKLLPSFNSRPRSLALARKSSQQLAALMETNTTLKGQTLPLCNGKSDDLKEYLSLLSKAYLVDRDIHKSSIGL